MIPIRSSIALAALAAGSLAPVTTPGASAQATTPTRSWQLALWTQAGYQHSMGRFATNSPYDIPELGLLDAIAEFSGARKLGGGVELALPASDFSFRLGWETTSGGEAMGHISICEIVDANLCREEVAPTRMRSVTFDARSSRAGPQRRIAPVLALGLGLRWYEFSVPDCNGLSQTGKLVCEAITDIYRDAKPNVILRMGGGFRAHLGRRLLAELAAGASTGRYTGGAGNSEGQWYHEVHANLSVGVVVF